MLINNTKDLKTALRAGKYAWPGGYPCFFVADDGEALSFEVVKAEYKLVLRAVRDGVRDGWNVKGLLINWEGETLYCAHTGAKIESAYGDDE